MDTETSLIEAVLSCAHTLDNAADALAAVDEYREALGTAEAMPLIDGAVPEYYQARLDDLRSALLAFLPSSAGPRFHL